MRPQRKRRPHLAHAYTVGPAFGEQKFEALSVGMPCYVAARVRMLAVREVSSFLLAHAFGWMPCSNSSTAPQLCLGRVYRGTCASVGRRKISYGLHALRVRTFADVVRPPGRAMTRARSASWMQCSCSHC